MSVKVPPMSTAIRFICSTSLPDFRYQDILDIFSPFPVYKERRQPELHGNACRFLLDRVHPWLIFTETLVLACRSVTGNNLERKIAQVKIIVNAVKLEYSI